MSHVAFISYSSKDMEVASNVMHYLEDNEIKCWMAPRDIVAGAHYASSILEAIKSAKIFILIFSANSDSSEQVLKEVDRAVNAKLPIIPFRIESHMPSEAMEYYLCNTHWLNAYGVEIVEKYFDDLVRNCRDLLSAKSVEPAKVKIEKEEDMPDRLKSIVNKMRDSAIKEEKEGLEFHERQLEEKRLLKEQEKREAEKKKLEKINNSLKKKEEKKESTAEIKIKAESLKNKKKASTKLIEGLVLLGVVFASWFLYSEYEKKNNQFETSVDLNEYVEPKTASITYDQLKEKMYSRLQVESLPTSDLKLLAGELRSKGGELFERVGHDLVEKKSNKNEIHNFLVINGLLNQRIAQEKQIDSPSDKVLINPSEEGELRIIEKQWMLASELQFKALDFYSVYISLRKESPFDKDFNLAKPESKILSIRFVESEESVIDVLCSNDEMLAVAKQILSGSSKLKFYFKKSEYLKYPNEIQVNVNNTQNIADGELSQVLVSLAFKLSNL